MSLLRRLFVPALALLATVATASEVVIDARQAAPAPTPLAFEIAGRSPSGHVLSANSAYLTLDGRPWYPIFGEFHYARYPASEWEREILKMKAGGVTIVATYVFWIHHEETEGVFDWSGQRDLRRFVDLCGRHGMQVWVRIGPWSHGEARNGGFPDWLVQSGIGLRQNDPRYLAHVQRFFGEIGRQLKGQYWADGGPIVGVQIENEYHPASQGIEHMQNLRRLAVASGINPPYFTATGWDNAVVPREGFLPVFGGYTEQFWSGLLTPLPPNQNFFFTRIRAEDNVMGDLTPKNPAYNAKYDNYPYLTAELGGGMAIAYHRRPVMQADDSTAAAVVRLGAGVNGLGFYMYHGGTNPDAKTPLQETQLGWNGYNDMEAKSYDFQAPLGEFGQVNATYRTLRTLHLFLHHFGATLATMAPAFPQVMPANRDDITTPRVAARTQGDRGFLFFNNHERNYPLGAKKDLQVILRLPQGDVTVPRQPTTLPEGAYPIWPINFDLGGTTLRYATAQLLTTVDDPATFVFFAWPGLAPEFAFTLPPGASVEAPAAQITRIDGVTYVNHLTPGPEIAIRVTPAAGAKPVAIVVLSRAQALTLTEAVIAGRSRLVLSTADVLVDGDRLEFTTREAGPVTFGVFPAVQRATAPFKAGAPSGIFQMFSAPAPKLTADAVALEKVRPADPIPPVKLSPAPRAVAMEPSDDDFARAAQWRIRLDPKLADPAQHAWVRIAYQGDVARIYADGRFYDDNFYKGPAWELALWRFAPDALARGLDLRILPLRRDAPIFLEPGAWPDFAGAGEVVRVAGVTVFRETRRETRLSDR